MARCQLWSPNWEYAVRGLHRLPLQTRYPIRIRFDHRDNMDHVDKTSTRAAARNLFAIIIGVFLLIEGAWGLFSPVVFGVLTTNVTHAIIHILLGAAGIGAGLAKKARGFCIFLGALLLAVGILRFLPGAGDLIVRVLNVNEAVAFLNIVVGVVGLAIGILPGHSTRYS